MTPPKNAAALGRVTEGGRGKLLTPGEGVTRNNSSAATAVAHGNGNERTAVNTKNARELVGYHAAAVGIANARAGRFVVPFSKRLGKGATGWPAKATRDEDVIERWFTYDYPGWQVAIVTGPGAGIWVPDLDRNHCEGVDGTASMAALEAVHGPLPRTFTVRTPRTGRHPYLKYPTDLPPGWTIGGSQSKIAPGIDVKGCGGLVLAPGNPGYEVEVDDVEIADTPPWLLELVQRPERPLVTGPPVTGWLATAAIKARARQLGEVDAGGRNGELNVAAYMLAAQGVDEEEARWRLLAACEINGLVADDGEPSCLATFESGWRAGSELRHGRS